MRLERLVAAVRDRAWRGRVEWWMARAVGYQQLELRLLTFSLSRFPFVSCVSKIFNSTITAYLSFTNYGAI
jgi:hypothetical protein